MSTLRQDSECGVANVKTTAGCNQLFSFCAWPEQKICFRYAVVVAPVVVLKVSSNRSQKTSKCGKNVNIGDTLGYASCVTFLFLPHFDVICNLLLNRRTATWNLFVKYMKKLLDSDWLKAVQFKCNTCAKSVTPVQITHRNSGL